MSRIGKVAVSRKWYYNDILAQAFCVSFASIETNSNLLLFLSYELTTNPGIQDKLYAKLTEKNWQFGCKQMVGWWVTLLAEECVKNYAYNATKLC